MRLSPHTADASHVGFRWLKLLAYAFTVTFASELLASNFSRKHATVATSPDGSPVPRQQSFNLGISPIRPLI
ncbi:hypothetical protein IH992_19355 [Candidatus Poribacteria bacterium]|nr:hypothetical protein [Candidatus Poribacteria bacterium]